MSGSQWSFSGIWQTFQSLVTAVNSIGATLDAGILVRPQPAVYTVAALPTTAAQGQWAFASNGRKPGEGAGVGTGCPVYFNSATATWFTTLNVVVTS